MAMELHVSESMSYIPFYGVIPHVSQILALHAKLQ